MRAIDKQDFKYDAFISYKRQGGLGWAELVWTALSNKQKDIFIDHSVSGGTQHPLISELQKEIDNSMNIIVVIYEGIQDVLKPQHDVFLKELKYAYKTKKNIIPFYVDGLSSSIINTEKRFRNLPPVLKKILSSKHSDICYIHSKSLDWADSLIKSFESADDVRKRTQYLVQIQSNEDCTLMVYYKDGIEKVSAGEIKQYWIDYEQTFMCEMKIQVGDAVEPIKYLLMVDPKSSEPYLSGYKARNCIEKGKSVSFPINWQKILEDQIKTPRTPADRLF